MIALLGCLLAFVGLLWGSHQSAKAMVNKILYRAVKNRAEQDR